MQARGWAVGHGLASLEVDGKLGGDDDVPGAARASDEVVALFATLLAGGPA